MGFAADLEKFKNKTSQKADQVTRKIVLDVGGSLVYKSPVGDASYWKNPSSAPPGYVGGRFRANWQHGIGSFDQTVTNNVNFRPLADYEDAAASVNFAAKLQPGKGSGEVHFLTNSLSYGPRLEDGFSRRQAPNGFRRLTMLEFQPIVTAVVRLLNK